MAVSFTKAQQEVLIDLNTFGEDQGTFEPFRANGAVESFLVEQAAQLVLEATRNLIAADRIASGRLEKSITPSEPKRSLNTIYIDISLLEYYRYVDKGARFPGKAPPIEPIKKWLRSEGSKQRNNQYTPISRRESKRKKAQDGKPMSLDSRAYLVSQAIKKKGLEPTLFWTKAIAKIQKNVETLIGEQVKIEVINSLK